MSRPELVISGILLRIAPFFVTSIFLIGCSRPGNPPLPFANLSPEVRYVGSSTCASCHQEIYDSYSRSEMGRAMSRMEPSNIIEVFPQKKPVYDGTKDYYYEMIQRNGRYFQREFRLDTKGLVIHERLMEAHYVMGSGNNLRMYFHDENGMLYELPLTWYVHRREWDLSPGYRDHENLRFSRFAGRKCISCHNSFLPEAPDAEDRFVPPYELGIGCERCHGPGELHVNRMLAGQPPQDDTPPSIVNPAKLPPQEQLDVCQQCHLMGKAWVLRSMDHWFGYRPGVPLSTHRSVYFPERTMKEVIEVGDSPQRLALSACFRESGGSLTCISCHNPHYSIKTFPAEHYTERCMRCHSAEDLSARNLTPAHPGEGNCVSCHMKQTGTDNTLHGVSNTDHWIRVDAAEAEIDWSLVRRPLTEKESVRLVPFLDASDGGERLRQGMAYSYYFREHDNRPRYNDSALAYLEPGVAAIPNDPQGRFRLAAAYREADMIPEALAALLRARDLSPGSHKITFELAELYSALDEMDSSIALYRSALDAKPGHPSYMEGLAAALARNGAWPEAVHLFEQSLAIDSTNFLAHLYLGNIFSRYLNRPADAVGHFRTSLMLEPDHMETRTNLGNAYYLSGDLRGALRAYREQVEIWPGTYEAWVNMGRVLAGLGENEEARRALGKAIQLRPDQPAAFEVLEQLQAN